MFNRYRVAICFVAWLSDPITPRDMRGHSDLDVQRLGRIAAEVGGSGPPRPTSDPITRADVLGTGSERDSVHLLGPALDFIARARI